MPNPTLPVDISAVVNSLIAQAGGGNLAETDTSNMSIYEGMGVGVADGSTITHDGTFAGNVNGNSTVVSPVTTATVITIN